MRLEYFPILFFAFILLGCDSSKSEKAAPPFSPTEGVYIAHPLQLQTSADFRDNGTMFMYDGNLGIWFNWVENGTQIIATVTSKKFKGETLVFEKKNSDLFLRNVRFSKQK